MQFNKLSSMLAMILGAHLSLFSFAAVADVTFDGSSVNIPHLEFGDEAYTFDFDLIDAENIYFQINLSTAVDITNSINVVSIPDAVFDGSAIVISHVVVGETIYFILNVKGPTPIPLPSVFPIILSNRTEPSVCAKGD